MKTVCKHTPETAEADTWSCSKAHPHTDEHDTTARFEPFDRASEEKRFDHETDGDLQRRVECFLKGLNIPALRLVGVQVRKSIATVTGTVHSFHEKQIATSCCQRVAGVQRVENRIRVVAG